VLSFSCEAFDLHTHKEFPWKHTAIAAVLRLLFSSTATHGHFMVTKPQGNPEACPDYPIAPIVT